MPRKRNAVPTLRRHKHKKLGYIKVNGVYTYLGHWPDGMEQAPEAVWESYQRAVCELRARGGPALPRHQHHPNANVPAWTPTSITVAELTARWMKWAASYYVRPDGTQTGELDNFRLALRPLVHLYGREPASDFTPRS
jgi:hypothetical protein